ncbi:hypothetical protein GCM10008938_48870 [Deinococcus roseus]|uniref:Uncharacterized protein n=1 Tax=Deinococcus roseus TaxID=392414 RepID=A0ABQ2DH32_9DEIO|nr:hypothetical protein GCM10008938_48870 [Deinococcus roseus]
MDGLWCNCEMGHHRMPGSWVPGATWTAGNARETILEALILTCTINKIVLVTKQTGENLLPKIEGLVK